MLGKLIRYEIPALGRKLVPLYIGWAATAVVLGIMVGPLAGKSEFLMVISAMLYAGVATAIFVMAVILIVQRYKNSLLGDEGYFAHTLPVTASEHIASKAVAALVWVLLSGVALMLTGLLIAVFSGSIKDLFSLDWGLFFQDIFEHFDLKAAVMIVELIIVGALSITKSIMQIYTALTIGHQAKDRPSIASIGAYIGLMVAESFLGRLLMAVIPDNVLMNFSTRGGFMIGMLVAAVIMMAISAVYFFICRYLMETRLDLN